MERPCQVTKAGTRNQPLPQIVKSWKLPGLGRPSTLPEHYDTRIDEDSIFVLPSNPNTGESGLYYVVPKGCTRCVSELRQRCDRALPCCGRCNAPSQCDVGKSWQPLPGEKISKGSRDPVQTQKPSKAKPGTTKPTAETFRLSVPGINKSGRPSRQAAPKPGALNLATLLNGATASDEVPLPSKPGQNPKVLPQDAPIPKKGPPSEFVVTSPTHKKPLLGRKPAKTAHGVNKRKPGRPRREDGSVKPKTKPLKERSHAKKPPAQSRWQVVQPVRPLSLALLGPEIAEKPRIWTSSKEELIEIFPALATGIACRQCEAPMLFIEGPSWPEDSWNNNTVVLSMVRECIIPNAGRGPTVENATSSNVEMIQKPYEPDGDEPMRLIGADDIESMGFPSNPHPQHDHNLNLEQSYSNTTGTSSPTGFYSAAYVHTNTGYKHDFPIYDTSLAHGSLDYRRINEPHVWQGSVSAPSGMRGAFGPQALTPIHTAMLRNQLENRSARHINPSNVIQPFPYFPEPEPGPNSDTSATTASSSWPATPPDVEAQGVTLPTKSWHGRPSSRERSLPPSLGRPCGTAYTLSRSGTPNIIATPITGNTPSLVEEQIVERLVSPASVVDPSVEESCEVPMSDSNGQTVIEIHSSPVADIPLDPPDEVQALLDAKQSRFPVNLIISKDSTLLPYTLKEQYGCLFLGLFAINDMKSTVQTSPEENGGMRYTVRWTFTFEWIPGGDLDPTLPQPSVPWWKSQSSTMLDGNVTVAHPFSILPPIFTLQHKSVVDREDYTVVEPIIRRGWHCNECGKINVQRLYSFQRCTVCDTPNGTYPVAAIYMRDPHNTLPVTLPYDRYPVSVSSTQIKNEESGLRTFTYSIQGNVTVNHFFTCNEKALQEYANTLFKDFQTSVKLELQGAKTTLAAGPYFTYLAGSGHGQGHPSDAWDEVPPCVDIVRKKIEDLTHTPLENMTILAWYASGHKKSSTSLPAKNRSITFLSLGADVELTLYPVSGFPVSGEPSDPLPISAAYPEEDPDYMMVDEEDEIITAGLLYEAHKAEQILPVPSAGVTPPGKGKAKKREKGEEIVVTLVHGDVLRLFGDDFEWSMKRTGMSIGMTAQT